MYIRILLLSLLQCSYLLGPSRCLDIPTVGYSLNAKDIPTDSRRRRQKPRFQESLRLKPPPPDWPSPTMGAADFLYDQPEVTPLSPLQAYQAKLQEEYLKDLEGQSQKKPMQKQHRVTEAKSDWTSSDEEFKKLLDPNELLKLNKKLAPILNQQTKIASQLKGMMSTEKTKVETSLKPKRFRRKLTVEPEYHMRKSKQPRHSDDAKASLENQKPRLKKLKRKKAIRRKVGEENTKVKKRKVKAKKFAFDIHRSSESDSKMYPKDSGNGRSSVSVSKEKRGKSSSSSASSDSSQEFSSTIKDTFTNGTTSTTEVSQRVQKTESVKKTTISNVNNLNTSSTERIFIKSSTLGEKMIRHETTTSDKKMEVREKRKQIKQEMEKVLKEEQLESSFGDGDSQWTTSETPKFPIINVTPHEALMGILKHKVVRFLDNILKNV